MAASILAVMAHPDDAELWAGGTLAHHARTGATVTIAVPRHDLERDAEAAAGAVILGADLRILDHLTVPAVRNLLDQVRPEVVITHRIDDVHPTTGTPPPPCSTPFPRLSSPPAAPAGSTPATPTTPSP